MALKNVKGSGSGSKHNARYNTRAEAKAGARQVRRAEDKAVTWGRLAEIVGKATVSVGSHPDFMSDAVDADALVALLRREAKAK